MPLSVIAPIPLVGHSGLSTRERQVPEGLVAGSTNKAIAFDLEIVPLSCQSDDQDVGK